MKKSIKNTIYIYVYLYIYMCVYIYIHIYIPKHIVIYCSNGSNCSSSTLAD